MKYPVAIHGLRRIEDDVHHQVIQLLCIGQHRGKIRLILFLEIDILKKSLIFEEKECSSQRLVDVVRLHQMACLTGKLQELFDCIPGPLGISQDTMQVFLGTFFQCILFQHQFGKEGNPPQRIVDLMSNTGSKFSQGGHFFGLQ